MSQRPPGRASASVSGEVATGSGRAAGSDLLKELRFNVCRCGAPKVPLRTFCGACYRALPPTLQKALYRRFGKGYENAYAEAAAYLDAHVRGVA